MRTTLLWCVVAACGGAAAGLLLLFVTYGGCSTATDASLGCRAERATTYAPVALGAAGALLPLVLQPRGVRTSR